MKNLIYGAGLNDADYQVTRTENYKQVWCCPFYSRWHNMIKRCYSTSSLKDSPTYAKCSVCPEWLVFSNFKAWMEKQDWNGKHLDKDILSPGNTVYSPDHCCFVDQSTNNFIVDSAKSRGELPLGVYFNRIKEKYAGQCRNPFTGKTEGLGYYLDPAMAHNAWLSRKRAHAHKLAKSQSDPRVSAALIARYSKTNGGF